MKIHIVDSVKGGSGKSTFSLKLCCALKSQRDVKPCVIDLDLLGTSWYHLYENCLKNNPIKRGRKFVFLNDVVKDFNYYKNAQFIQKIKLKDNLTSTDKKDGLEIDAIFCDPSPVAKEIYKVDENKYTTDISYDVFRDEFMALLNYLDVEGYTDIILDMPPNSEPYSDKILHTCFKVDKEYDYIKSANLYMVSSVNLAHINSTFDWFVDFIENTDRHRTVTKNDFSEIKKIVVDETTKREEYKKDKWFDSDCFKFFFVFNETNNPPSSYEIKNLISSSYYDIGRELVFYRVAFDNMYYESMYAMLGFPVPSSIGPGTIVINPLDMNDYMLFDEFLATKK